MIKRHKVFISYHHALDQAYKDYLIGLKCKDPRTGLYVPIFEDYSVHEDEVDDTGLTDEQVRRIIRDEYIKDASVLILLCGQETKRRKFIDWELYSAMSEYPGYPKMGIVVLNLPGIDNDEASYLDDIRQLVDPLDMYFSLSKLGRSQLERKYPYLPERVIDCLEKGVPIEISNWLGAVSSPEDLMQLIDNAYTRRDEINYGHLKPLRQRNSNGYK